MVATIDLNSSAVQEIEELYGKSRRVNYIFDSISAQFNGQKSEFTLESDGSNISGIVTDTAILLISDVFQTSGEES